MIKNEITFVLGAGASYPYGFPLGDEFVQMIIELLDPVKTKNRALLECLKKAFYSDPLTTLSSPEGKINDFREELIDSGESSIDAFLQHRPELQNMGKHIIAGALLSCEKKRLTVRKDNKHWYQLLLPMLDLPYEEFENNKVSFVTYNYDRSLEQFLFNAFKNREKSKTSNEKWAKKLFECIPIVHLHGKLGSHPAFCEPNAPHVVEYGVGLSASNESLNVIKASAEIRIVSDKDVDKDPYYENAHKLISKSKCVCFLGFGFDKRNAKRLHLHQHATCQLMGSVYGMTKAEIAQLQVKVDKRMEHNKDYANPAHDCAQFIRESFWIQANIE